MQTDDEVVLVFRCPGFFGRADKDGFYEWIAKIPAIARVEGCGWDLHLTVNSSIMSDALVEMDRGIWDLMGLFFRYEIDMRVLAKLDRFDASGILRDKGAFWYRRIYPQENFPWIDVSGRIRRLLRH